MSSSTALRTAPSSASTERCPETTVWAGVDSSQAGPIDLHSQKLGSGGQGQLASECGKNTRCLSMLIKENELVPCVLKQWKIPSEQRRSRQQAETSSSGRLSSGKVTKPGTRFPNGAWLLRKKAGISIAFLFSVKLTRPGIVYCLQSSIRGLGCGFSVCGQMQEEIPTGFNCFH